MSSPGSSHEVVRKDAYIQAIRGLAIAAVVTIHCLTPSEAVAVFRPLLNWCVAVFIFISGYLTTPEKVRGGACCRRLKKILVPYLIWTFIYILVERRFSLWGMTKAVLLGDSATQMYYLVVYAQLIALTPLLYKLLDARRWLLYWITPVALLIRAALALVNIDLPLFYSFFPGWLLFYVVGLDWGYWKEKFASIPKSFYAIALFAGILLQVLSALFWYGRDDWTMAVTQLKPSVLPAALMIVVLLFTASKHMRSRVGSSNLLVLLGDLSFGIYLCHVVALKVPRKVFETLGMTSLIWGIVLSMVVLAASAGVVLICQRKLSKRTLARIGFA